MVGEVESRQYVLLDQEDGETGPVDLPQHFGDAFRRARRQPSESSSIMSNAAAPSDRVRSRTSVVRRPRMSSHPAGGAPRGSGTAHRPCRDRDRDPMSVLVAQVGAQEQVVSDGQAAEQPAPFRYMRDPGGEDVGRAWHRQGRGRRSGQRPRRGAIRPEIVRRSVDLPAPFDPTRQTIEPAFDGEIDAPQHLYVAIAGGDALNASSGLRHGPIASGARRTCCRDRLR